MIKVYFVFVKEIPGQVKTHEKWKETFLIK